MTIGRIPKERLNEIRSNPGRFEALDECIFDDDYHVFFYSARRAKHSLSSVDNACDGSDGTRHHGFAIPM